uniref:Putative TPR repeat domain protein n=1 Tax=uncultured bacterium EIL80E09 TaxID=1768207 RepID=A0A0U2P1G2_9BACT|nr:putative TPR repeat domain protein [uncultured bacterium EIL80E09]
MSKNNSVEIAYQNAKDLIDKKDYIKASEQLNEILKVFPNELNSIYLLIDCYIKLNNPIKALEFTHSALNIKNDDKKLLQLEIRLNEYLERDSESIHLLKIFIDKFSDLGALKHLSNLLVKQDKSDEADELIKNFFENNEDYGLLYKGVRHLHASRYRKAEDAFKKVLIEDENNIDALRFMGILAFKSGNHDIAEAMLTKALKLDPTYSLVWANLAQVFSVTGQLDKAKKSFKNILNMEPKNGLIWAEYGTVLTKLANYKEGRDAYLKALEFKPDSPRVHLSLGHVYKTMGEIDNSIDSYKNTILQNNLSGEAYWSLANLKTYSFSENEIKDMEDTLKVDMSDIERSQMHFALGKAYEVKKDFDKSFKNYYEGNKVKKGLIKYSSDDTTDNTKRILNFFNKDNIQKLAKSSTGDRDPIFVLGMPRSGSTLIDQIISSHSKVDGTQELPNIIKIAAELNSNNQKNYPEVLKELDESKLSNLGKDYISETAWARDSAPFFIDKMPNNFIHIGLIKTILPNAKIIDTRRDPMDTCFSCFKQFFARGQLFTYSLEDLGNYYTDYIRAMNHWHNVYGKDIYTVHYDNVINETEETIRELIDYCELPFEKECLEFYNSSRPVKTPSAEQVRQPIYKSGLNYWKNYEEHLLPLKKIIDEIN